MTSRPTIISLTLSIADSQLSTTTMVHHPKALILIADGTEEMELWVQLLAYQLIALRD